MRFVALSLAVDGFFVGMFAAGYPPQRAANRTTENNLARKRPEAAGSRCT